MLTMQLGVGEVGSSGAGAMIGGETGGCDKEHYCEYRQWLSRCLLQANQTVNILPAYGSLRMAFSGLDLNKFRYGYGEAFPLTGYQPDDVAS
jgi:hypothetical protein